MDHGDGSQVLEGFKGSMLRKGLGKDLPFGDLG